MRTTKFLATMLATLAIASPCFADTLTGLWRGEYHCGQGLTGVTLALREDESGRVAATFSFYEHPKNPGVPPGCFALAGRRNADALTLNPQHWIKQPDPYWYMIDLTGKLSRDGTRYSGTIDTPPAGWCSTFSVTRISHALPPAGAAACDGADLVS